VPTEVIKKKPANCQARVEDGEEEARWAWRQRPQKKKGRRRWKAGNRWGRLDLSHWVEGKTPPLDGKGGRFFRSWVKGEKRNRRECRERGGVKTERLSFQRKKGRYSSRGENFPLEKKKSSPAGKKVGPRPVQEKRRGVVNEKTRKKDFKSVGKKPHERRCGKKGNVDRRSSHQVSEEREKDTEEAKNRTLA